MTCRETVIEKISQMPKEQVSKVLIFMAGMEAEHEIKAQLHETGQPQKPSTGCSA